MAAGWTACIPTARSRPYTSTTPRPNRLSSRSISTTNATSCIWVRIKADCSRSTRAPTVCAATPPARATCPTTVYGNYKPTATPYSSLPSGVSDCSRSVRRLSRPSTRCLSRANSPTSIGTTPYCGLPASTIPTPIISRADTSASTPHPSPSMSSAATARATYWQALSMVCCASTPPPPRGSRSIR